MGRSDLSGQAEFQKSWKKHFFNTSYFCWRIAFGRPHLTSGDQNTVNTNPHPIFTKKAFGPLCNAIKDDPAKYLSWFPSTGPKSKKFPFFTDFFVRLQKKYWVRVRSILMPPTFYIDILNSYIPKFSGVP